VSSVFIIPLEPPEPSRWERALAAVERRLPLRRRGQWQDIGYTTDEE